MKAPASPPATPHASELRECLQAMGSARLAEFSLRLIPNLSHPMLGVRIPHLRSLARQLARDDWRSLADSALPADVTFEELLLRGFVIGYARMEWAERWQRIMDFMPLIDNWAVCDCCCSSFTDVRKHRDEVFPLLERYAATTIGDMATETEATYRQRFACVMLMDHFITDSYIGRVLQVLASLRPVGYYAVMAAGWALSVAFVKHPESTLAVLNDAQVHPETRRTACRKILESHRTTDTWRPVIKALLTTIPR